MEKRSEFNLKDSLTGGLWGILSPILVSFVLSMAILLSAGLNSNLNEYIDSNIWVSIVASILGEGTFLLIAVLLCKKREIDFFKATNARPKTSAYVYILAVIFGVVCVLCFNNIIGYWENFLILIGYDVSGSLGIPLTNAGYLVLSLFLVAALPAICEEFLFRGVILNGLRKYGVVVSVLFSAVLFGLMHGNLQQLPYTLILGIALGLIAYYSKNIWLCVIIHFVNNATVLLFSYFLTNQGSFEFTAAEIAVTIVLAIVGVLLIAGFAYLLYRKNKESTKLEPLNAAQKKEKNIMFLPVGIGVAIVGILSLSQFGVI